MVLVLLREGVKKLDFLGNMSSIRGGGSNTLPLKKVLNVNQRDSADKKGFFIVHSYYEDYLSIPGDTGS